LAKKRVGEENWSDFTKETYHSNISDGVEKEPDCKKNRNRKKKILHTLVTSTRIFQ